MTDEPPVVLVERTDHVMIVTINRPAVRNCVNMAVHLGVGEALEAADRDPHIRAVILTGAGEQAFCAGADLKALARGERLIPEDPATGSWGFCGYVQHHISKPTIAAVNGAALGGGTELALASDLVVAADTATFGLPEVKRGILAGAGGAFRIVEQLPQKIGLELLLTGEPITAEGALALGLINAVTPRDRLREAALTLAGRIAVNAPLAVQASKRIARRIRDGRIEAETAAWENTRRESAVVRRSEDAIEGPRAFAEKRPPVWKAR